MFPTLPTLLRIAMVFGVELDYFFADQRKHPRAGRRPTRRAPALSRGARPARSRVSFREPDVPGGRAEVPSLPRDVPPGGRGQGAPHEHTGVEVIYVLSGELRVTIETTEHLLRERRRHVLRRSSAAQLPQDGPFDLFGLVFVIP